MAYWLDDGFDTWGEVFTAGTEAAGLYARCGAWVARNLTDGFIPAGVVAAYGTAEWAGRLVSTGLWTTVEGGYRDTRYLDLNPTAEKARANKARKAEAGRKGGLASGKSRRANQTRSRGEAGASRLVEPPSLPPPSTKEGKGARPASLGATRAPSDNPDWRSLPAYGQAEPPRETPARAAARDAATRARRTRPSGRDAFTELRLITDEETA